MTYLIILKNRVIMHKKNVFIEFRNWIWIKPYTLFVRIVIYSNLTSVFSLKKSSDFSPIEYIGNINITEALKYFQYSEFKTRLVQIYFDD